MALPLSTQPAVERLCKQKLDGNGKQNGDHNGPNSRQQKSLRVHQLREKKSLGQINQDLMDEIDGEGKLPQKTGEPAPQQGGEIPAAKAENVDENSGWNGVENLPAPLPTNGRAHGDADRADQNQNRHALHNGGALFAGGREKASAE